MSILQFDYVLRKPLARGQFIDSGIRNVKVISVSHCGGRILLGCDIVFVMVRSGQYTKKW